MAGTETTASVPSRVLYGLARNPDVDERVRAELDEVLADRPAAFAYLPRPYTGAWEIPAGTEPAYCRHPPHRDPGLFPGPLVLDPDRRLGENRAPLPGGTFLLFGAGKHKRIPGASNSPRAGASARWHGPPDGPAPCG